MALHKVGAAVLLLGLAGCNAGDTLALAPSANPPAATAQGSAPAANLAIAMAPVTGAPESFAKVLAAELLSQSASLGLPVGASPASPSYVLKGYVSALDEQPPSYVFVWDLSDSAGNRVHRIQGQEKAAPGDPWSAASADAARRIAGRTAEQLAVWLAANAG